MVEATAHNAQICRDLVSVQFFLQGDEFFQCGFGLSHRIDRAVGRVAELMKVESNVAPVIKATGKVAIRNVVLATPERLLILGRVDVDGFYWVLTRDAVAIPVGRLVERPGCFYT